MYFSYMRLDSFLFPIEMKLIAFSFFYFFFISLGKKRDLSKKGKLICNCCGIWMCLVSSTYVCLQNKPPLLLLLLLCLLSIASEAQQCNWSTTAHLIGMCSDRCLTLIAFWESEEMRRAMMMTATMRLNEIKGTNRVLICSPPLLLLLLLVYPMTICNL